MSEWGIRGKEREGEKKKIFKIQASLLIAQSWNRNSEKHHFCHVPFIFSESSTSTSSLREENLAGPLQYMPILASTPRLHPFLLCFVEKVERDMGGIGHHGHYIPWVGFLHHLFCNFNDISKHTTDNW